MKQAVRYVTSSKDCEPTSEGAEVKWREQVLASCIGQIVVRHRKRKMTAVEKRHRRTSKITFVHMRRLGERVQHKKDETDRKCAADGYPCFPGEHMRLCNVDPCWIVHELSGDEWEAVGRNVMQIRPIRRFARLRREMNQMLAADPSLFGGYFLRARNPEACRPSILRMNS